MVFVNSPVLIFTFHHISPFKDSLTVSPSLFEKALNYIAKKFNIISLEEFSKYLFEGLEIPKKSALITLDDGYLDNYIYAYPILKKLNIPATIFLITNMIKYDKIVRDNLKFKSHKDIEKSMDSKYFLNLTEIKEMESSGLITFESHTKNHYSCMGNNLNKIEDELVGSLEFIKIHFPKRYYSFCWPKGSFDDNSLSLIKNLEYSFAFSTIDGAFTKGEDIFWIKRVDISSSSNGEKDYLARLRKKSILYSTPLISKFYSDFKYFKRRK